MISDSKIGNINLLVFILLNLLFTLIYFIQDEKDEFNEYKI